MENIKKLFTSSTGGTPNWVWALVLVAGVGIVLWTHNSNSATADPLTNAPGTSSTGATQQPPVSPKEGTEGVEGIEGKRGKNGAKSVRGQQGNQGNQGNQGQRGKSASTSFPVVRKV